MLDPASTEAIRTEQKAWGSINGQSEQDGLAVQSAMDLDLIVSQGGAVRKFTTEQIQCLEIIRNNVASSLVVEAEDVETVTFNDLEGGGTAYRMFGGKLYPLLEELNGVLVA